MPLPLESLKPIAVERAADLVFSQLSGLIISGRLAPHERLPSERQLAERFGLNRVHVREALQRLEFYGLIELKRNVGAVVAQSRIRAVEGIFADVLSLSEAERSALTETRQVIEVSLAGLAAVRATETDLLDLQDVHLQFEAEVAAGGVGLEPDLRFHLRLAEAAQNPVLRVLVGLLANDLITLAKEQGHCLEGRARQALAEHAVILDAVRRGDAPAAEAAMASHVAYIQRASQAGSLP